MFRSIPPRCRSACLALVLWLGSAAVAPAFNTVVLDAGHGGHDKGATSRFVYEKHLALDTARRVEVLLRQRGIRVVMSRSRDNFVTLPNRSSLANRHSNAVFVSVHYNWARNASAQGIETFYFHRDSYMLASYIQAYMLRTTRATNRGVKHGRFHVIRETTRIPSVLVEGGFISNSTERSRLMNGAYRQRVAEGIAGGIIAYQMSLRRR